MNLPSRRLVETHERLLSCGAGLAVPLASQCARGGLDVVRVEEQDGPRWRATYRR